MTIPPTERLAKAKSIPKRQRPTEVNAVLAFAGGDSRIETPTAPTKNLKSETMTSDARRCGAAQGPERPGQAAVI